MSQGLCASGQHEEADRRKPESQQHERARVERRHAGERRLPDAVARYEDNEAGISDGRIRWPSQRPAFCPFALNGNPSHDAAGTGEDAVVYRSIRKEDLSLEYHEPRLIHRRAAELEESTSRGTWHGV